jgi:GDP-4-dehydro-6-deoxy-D-mannose reductase
MNRRLLITGVAGAVGRQVAAAARSQYDTVFGIARREPDGLDDFDVLVGDVTDDGFMAQAISRIRPSHVVHLAGVLGNGDPLSLYRVHVLGTLSLFEALLKVTPDARVVVSSSSAVYGDTTSIPTTEEEPVHPVSPYGFSKAAEELVTRQYANAGVDAMIVRTFNLIGPNLSDALLPGAVARQIAECELSGGRAIRVGNLSARRDYTDVRDAAAAYLLIAADGKTGETYNVSSGRSRPSSDLVTALAAHAHAPLEVVTDQSRMRANDTSEQAGSSEKLTRATGWKPSIEFEESIGALLESWRRTVRKSRGANGSQLAG